MVKKVVIGITIVFLLSAGVFVFSCYSFQVPSLYRMVQRGGSAEGLVIAKEPENHNHIRYDFKVGSATYEGSDGIGSRFEIIKPGDRVNVIYDPRDPTVSTLGNPREQLMDTLIISGGFSLLGGFLFAISIPFVLRRRR